MTGQDILRQVWATLSKPDGVEKIQSRRKVIEQLRNTREKWLGAGRKLRIHKPGVLTIDQTRMQNANRRLVAKVLVSGCHVADVNFDRKKPNPRFVVVDEQLPTSAVPEREIEWKNDDQSSRKISSILKKFAKLPPGSSELQVQLDLVRRLDASKAKDPHLAGLRPVLPFGLPTEIATSLNLEGHVATGNMDVLARTYGEGQRSKGGDFVVLELKRPSLDASDVFDALKQAIQYAAALTIEANALIGPPVVNAALAYRQLFSNTGKAEPAKYAGKPLVAHAVVVLPARLETHAMAALSKLELSSPLMVHASLRPMGVGVLLFSAEEKEGKWKLTNAPDAFRWIEHPHAWKPKQNRPRRSKKSA